MSTDRRDILNTMDYGPRPKRPTPCAAGSTATRPASAISSTAPSPSRGDAVRRRSTPPPASALARVTPGLGRRRRRRGRRGARARSPAWSALPGHERARHLYALARHVQKRERFLAVLETLDNGKPIRETRDIDVPLVARHFYHHAGWAELIESEFPGARAGRRLRPDHPVEFPAADAGLEDRAGAGRGNTVVLKPAEFTPLTALAFAEICVEAGLPPGVVNIVTGDGATGAALVAHPGVDKIAFTGSTEVGRLIRARDRGHGQEAVAGARRQVAVHRVRRRRSRQRRRGRGRRASGSTRARSAAPARGCWCRRASPARFVAQAARAHGDAARRRSARQVDRHRRHRRAGAARAHPRPGRGRAAPRARTSSSRRPTLPADGCFYPPTLLTERRAGLVAGARGDLRPGAGGDDLPHARRGGRARQQHPLRPRRLVWTENINLALDVAARIKAGVVWINSTNLFDAGAGFGGYRESGFGREGGREGLAEYLVLPDLPRAPRRPPTPRSSAPRRGRRRRPPGIDRTAKLYIGGKQARPDGGAVLRRARRRRAARSARPASATARTSATRSRPPPRRPAGARRRRTTARRCSTTSPKTSRPAPPNSPRGCAR